MELLAGSESEELAEIESTWDKIAVNPGLEQLTFNKSTFRYKYRISKARR